MANSASCQDTQQRTFQYKTFPNHSGTWQQTDIFQSKLCCSQNCLMLWKKMLTHLICYIDTKGSSIKLVQILINKRRLGTRWNSQMMSEDESNLTLASFRLIPLIFILFLQARTHRHSSSENEKSDISRLNNKHLNNSYATLRIIEKTNSRSSLILR
jgi:hypothetical protein